MLRQFPLKKHMIVIKVGQIGQLIGRINQHET